MDQKRRERRNVKVWTKEDKDCLLKILKERALEFEKPTAQLFYTKIIEDNTFLATYGWRGMRDKVRNLRLNYGKMVEWRNTRGSRVGCDVPEQTVREYMLKKCPDYDLLDQLFASRQNITSQCIPVEMERAEDYAVSVMREELEEITPVVLTEPHKKKKRTIKGRSFLVEFKKEKLTIMRENLKLAREKFEEEKRYNKLKLEIKTEELQLKREMQMKELEMKKEEFLFKRVKLENDLKLHEMELKYKYGKD